MIVLLFKMILQHISLSMVKYIPWTQGMCEEAVHMEPYWLGYVPDHFKTQEMCEKAVEKFPQALEFVSDHFKTQVMLQRGRWDRPTHAKICSYSSQDAWDV